MGLTIEQMRGVSAANGTTKAKIERAAIIRFAQYGIDGVSTKQIAHDAGCSEGAIYRHFSGKEDLARTLMQTIHVRLTHMISEARAQENSLPEKITYIVHHYCRIADDDWDLFAYHILHLHHFPKLTQKPDDSPQSAATKLLKAAMDAGHIPQSDPQIKAAMALGVVLQTAQTKVLGYIQGPLSARAASFEKAVLAVIEWEA